MSLEKALLTTPFSVLRGRAIGRLEALLSERQALQSNIDNAFSEYDKELAENVFAAEWDNDKIEEISTLEAATNAPVCVD